MLKTLNNTNPIFTTYNYKVIISGALVEAKYKKLVGFIRSIYGDGFIPLHEPCFVGNEKKYINECIDSTFVSSVGKFVDRFEEMVCEYTGAKYAVATVNGTAALHISLLLAGVEPDDEVITQPLTFIATCNAIKYCQAVPVFIDVSKKTLGLSSKSLSVFLENETYQGKGGFCYNKSSGRRIKAVVPMHTFGLPCEIDEIVKICDKYHIDVVEDSAEAIGSWYKNKHCGTFGKLGVFSFNGNKTITCGGGGVIITNNEEYAINAKYITTTAKIPHRWEFKHDVIGYNYRMPNVNAAIACAQLEKLELFVNAKREVHEKYKIFCDENDMNFIKEPPETKANHWLNALVLENKVEREDFLEFMNKHEIMTRPIWTLMNKLEMFSSCQCADLANSLWFEDRLVNIPSSVPNN